MKIETGASWMAPSIAGPVVREVVGTMRHPRTGQLMFAVSTEGIRGQELFSEDDVAFEIKRDTANIRHRVEAEERAAREAEEAAEALYVDGFELEFPERQRPRILEVLNKQVGVRGVFLSRKEHVKNLLEEGFEIRIDPRLGRILEGPRGGFFTEKDLTKTAFDYAEYLLG